MRKIALLLLLSGFSAIGQTIQKNDGTTLEIPGGQIHVEPGNKRLAYFEKDSKKAKYVKFKDLKQAHWADFSFKTLNISGKTSGYYVMAEQDAKSLLLRKRTRIKSRGGFESTYTRYELVIWEAKSTATLSFTDENTAESIAERAAVIALIKSHFANCKPLIDKVTAFESSVSDTQNRTILVLLNEPTFVKCQ